MSRNIRISVCCIVLLSGTTKAQVIPAENSTINYTQVLFEVPEVNGATEYMFTVAEDDADFGKGFIQKRDNSQVTIIDGFDFGKDYQWKAAAFNEEGIMISESEVHHFRIGTSDFIDSTLNRFRVIKETAGSYKDGVIFLDYSGVAINRSGKPVWYLPELEGVNVSQERFRDLKLSSAGTVTFNAMRLCREISLDGSTLWETPGDSGLVSNEDKEFYHHEFTRLHSGNYVVLGKRYINKELMILDQKVERIPLSVIIEYNRDGDTVWTWNSDSYINDSDLQLVGQKLLLGNTFGHMNSTFVDEENNLVYACFRDLNAIVVIDRKTRKVIRSYGDKIPSDTSKQAIGYFHKQHAPVLMENGKIIVFDNGDEGRNTISRIVVFTEAYTAGDSSKLDWVFPCNFDTLMPAFSPRMGNAQPMDTSHYLVNMGKVARLFEVTHDKQITWDCLPERWDEGTAEWKPQSNYRLAYSSSLYPCYFSISLKPQHTEEKVLRIFNEGSEDDAYTVHFIADKDTKKKYDTSIESGLVGSGKVLEIPLRQLREKIWRKGFTVEVRSKNNAQLVKTAHYSL